MKQPKKEDAFISRVMKHQIGRFAQQLRVALQHVDAPSGFADRVLARAAKDIAGSVRLQRDRTRKRAISCALCLAIISWSCFAAARAQSHEVIRGTVTAVSDGVLTVKSDAGGEVQVKPDPAAQIQKLAAGSTDVKSGVTATVGDISVGDRVLISANVPESGLALARIVFVMKASDIAQKQAAEQADWQKRGMSGLVRLINPTANTVKISVASVAGTKNVTIQMTDKTQLMRYASDSVKFADARPGPLTLIQPGDQLTARGDKSPDGVTMIADEIVTGSFRNISGQIVRIDPANDTLTVKDLATKATVTVALTNNTDMRMLPQTVATTFAARLKDGAAAGPAVGQSGGQNNGGRSASSDLTQMIGSMPPVALAQLKPGDALMIAVTTSAKANVVTAISLLSGVEPILAAPEASSMTLAPWSLSSGSPN
jgi:hypothetical protein